LDLPPTDAAGLDGPLILRRFRGLGKDLPRWHGDDGAWLTQLSRAKLLIWLDPEAKTDPLLQHQAVAHLFGGRDAPGDLPPGLAAPLVEESALERARPAADLVTVMDADPSQLQALFAAMDGSSFVLQGPPGTGKSQTITNLIGK